MAAPIDMAGQTAMDLYYKQYKSPSDFFDLADFITHTAGVVGNLYMEGYKKQYAELRQDQKDEVVAFDPTILNESILKVEKDEHGDWCSKLEHGVMSFPYDEQGIGVQDVIPIRPLKGVKMERTTLAAHWQLEHVPNCNIVFWYLQRDKVKFLNKSSVQLHEVQIWYVPSIYDPAFLVPDSIFEFVVTTSAATIKEIVKGTTVKQSVDGNANQIPQTEINALSLK